MLDVRDSIEQLIKEQKIDRARFFEVSKHSYKQIIKKIEYVFVDKSMRWDNGIHWANMGNYNPKLNWTGILLKGWDDWMAELPYIIPNSNDAMYILFEGRTKYWLYEAFISELTSILGEIEEPGDFYIVSKKIDWLISLNHHNYISYVGDNLNLNIALPQLTNKTDAPSC